MSEDVLRVENVSKRFGPVTALRDVNLHLGKGEVLGLLGDNGAGKSTLIKILTGLFPPDKGEILWNGEPVQFSSPRDAYDIGVATVYQDLAIIDLMAIYRNVFLGREKEVTKGMGPFRWIDRKKAHRDARQAISDMGIEIRDAEEPIARLSGGERQSIAIARASFDSAQDMLCARHSPNLIFPSTSFLPLACTVIFSLSAVCKLEVRFSNLHK